MKVSKKKTVKKAKKKITIAVIKEKAVMGRPAMFKTPQELEKKIDEYFKNIPTKIKHTSDGTPYEVSCPTITGLTLFLGFCDKQSFYDYEHDKPNFSYYIKKARVFIERHYEELLQMGSPTGAIFALKQFGWKDNHDLKLGGDKEAPLTINIIDKMLKL